MDIIQVVCLVWGARWHLCVCVWCIWNRRSSIIKRTKRATSYLPSVLFKTKWRSTVKGHSARSQNNGRTTENWRTRARQEGEETWLGATEKQALIETFSHTALRLRSAREIKQEDYTLAERLGSLLWLSATSTKSPLTMKLSVSRGLVQKHTKCLGWDVVMCGSFHPQKSESKDALMLQRGLMSMSEGNRDKKNKSNHLLTMGSIYSVDRTHQWRSTRIWCNPELFHGWRLQPSLKKRGCLG